jgi:hypothetical protein
MSSNRHAPPLVRRRQRTDALFNNQFKPNVGRFTFFAVLSVINARAANKRSELLRSPRNRRKSDDANHRRCCARLQRSERGLEYLWVREYRDWHVSPALRVPRTDAAYRTTHNHPEPVVRLARPQLRHLS